jgi:hypothetical protein
LLTEQELAQLVAVPQQIHPRITASATEVPQRLVRFIGDPHGSQVPTPQQPRQLHSVAAIILHAIARPLRDQARRYHNAGCTHLCEAALETVAARAGFVAARKSRRRPKTVQ